MKGKPTVLILSAAVGGGHDAAARALREELLRDVPEATVIVRNGIEGSRGGLRFLLERLLRWQLLHCPRAYAPGYALVVRSRLGRAVALRTIHRLVRRRLLALVASRQPDLIVSTYPGITAALGSMRVRGTISVPVCSVITDIAGLHFWAHPGVDLHMACYRESLPEIASVSRGADSAVIRPLLGACHHDRHERRASLCSLELSVDLPLVVVSGGGWGVGDLRGAVSAARECGDVQVVVICGDNARAEHRLHAAYAGDARVRVLGHTASMAPLLAAASALVHSTGGVTCLEAAAHRCPVIAYGFTFGHLRENLEAMTRHELVRWASDKRELVQLLRATITAPPPSARGVPRALTASSLLVELLGAQPVRRPVRAQPASSDALTSIPA